ncbi:MAG: hypothetical protein AAF648_07530 [Pseudomonadota bacterium]
MKALLCKLLFSCALAGPGAKPIDDLTYGTLLYDYFQDDYSAALVTAMVAEADGLRGDDAVRFELATGSFAFQEGLYDLAADTFGAIDPAELNDVDRLRLAFHLAREYHRRSDWVRLGEQLERIDLGKRWWGSAKTHPEVEFMRAELALSEQRFGEAFALLDALDDREGLKAYGLYNLGVALKGQPQTREDGSLLTASAAFAQLAELPATTEETYDLVQRGKLALAYLAEAGSEQAEAAAILEQLPTNGRYRNAALAAYGNLAMGAGEYELAARVWLTLKQEPYWTPSTAAARLGFPLSLENLASQERALAQYQRAESVFTNRLASLTSLEQRLAEPGYVRSLIATFASGDLSSEAGREALEQWRTELGHTDWLEWLATDRVNELLVDWRALREEEQWLSALPQRLSALEQVAGERQRRGAEARRLLVDENRLGARVDSEAALDRLDQRLAALAAEEPRLDWTWMAELGNADERELLEDLEQKAQLVAQHFTGDEAARYQRRIDRLRGVVLWDQTLTHATRLQARRGQVRANRELLATLDESLGRLQSAEQSFVDTVGIDFARFSAETDRLRDSVALAIQSREEQLALELRGGMRREMAQVGQYLLVTRVAIARTTDQLAGRGVPLDEVAPPAENEEAE